MKTFNGEELGAFFASQIGIISPLVFAGFCWSIGLGLKRFWRNPLWQETFLLSLALPMVALFTLVATREWVKMNWLIPAYAPLLLFMVAYYQNRNFQLEMDLPGLCPLDLGERGTVFSSLSPLASGPPNQGLGIGGYHDRLAGIGPAHRNDPKRKERAGNPFCLRLGPQNSLGIAVLFKRPTRNLRPDGFREKGLRLRLLVRPQTLTRKGCPFCLVRL